MQVQYLTQHSAWHTADAILLIVTVVWGAGKGPKQHEKGRMDAKVSVTLYVSPRVIQLSRLNSVSMNNSICPKG